jgi:hypothetical protein
MEKNKKEENYRRKKKMRAEEEQKDEKWDRLATNQSKINWCNILCVSYKCGDDFNVISLLHFISWISSAFTSANIFMTSAHFMDKNCNLFNYSSLFLYVLNSCKTRWSRKDRNMYKFW